VGQISSLHHSIYLFICCWAFFASGSISLACWWGPA
jgi:hypothetical protein